MAELIRAVNGPTRGRVVEIDDLGYKRTIVRDKQGRIVGVEGRSAVHDLIDEAADLAERIDRLEVARDGDADGLATLAERANALTDGIRQLAETVARTSETITVQTAQTVQTVQQEAAAVTATVTAAILDGQRSIHAQLDGWHPFDDRLEVNPSQVALAAQRIDLRWPVTIERMSDEERVKKDAIHGGRVDGYRAPSNSYTHTIALRHGQAAEATALTIGHELVHCRQVEMLGNDFDTRYTEDPEAFESQARELAPLVVVDLALVRRSHDL